MRGTAMRWRIAAIAAAGAGSAITALPGTARALEAPLWEVGLGVGALAFADYRGADTGQVLPIPVPLFIYRGERLKADRDGLHGLVLRQRQLSLTVSVGATTPVRRGTSLARQGMPGLRPTVEAGPSLEWKLWRAADGKARIDLRLPLMLSFTVEPQPRQIGGQFAPRINLDVADIGGHRGWNLGLLAGPLYGDRRYHDYFYGVPSAYATATRSAYGARGGYAGAQAVVALTRRYPRHWVGFFARHDWLQGAAFEASPLVRSHGYWMAGAGVAWLIGHSARSVTVADEWP